ncbi:hypothetical protein ACOMHN_055840 [Nucella lapillus]
MPSPVESYVPFMPNVLKVFLENGQTKSFKYDNKTTVKDVVMSLQEKLNLSCVHRFSLDVVMSLQEKLNLSCVHHFSLVLQNMKNNSGTAAKMTLLQHHETLAEIAARQGARYFRCLFRVTFVPKDAYDLLKEDPIAFEYFYLQCCNDVIHERFASEMKYDTALRLAALQIQQHAIANNMAPKISIKAVIRDCGLDRFVSRSLLESMKGKELKRMLTQYLKMNQSLAAPGQKQLTALQAKLHYMKIVSRLKTFGSRVFMVTLLDKRTEAMLLVGPQSGISIVTNIKSYSLTQLADFEDLDEVRVTRDGEGMQRVDLRLKAPRVEGEGEKGEGQGEKEGEGKRRKGEGKGMVSLGLLAEDAHNLVCLLAGYFAIFVDPERLLVERTMGKNTSDPDVPTYESVHRVQAAAWSYPEDLVSEVVVVGEGDGEGVSDNQRLADLGQDPPDYQENEQYLSRVKQDLGIQASQSAAEAGTVMTSVPAPNTDEVTIPVTDDVITRVNGAGGSTTPFEEAVTSFGTFSSDNNTPSSTGSNSSFSLPMTPLPPSSPTSLHSIVDLRQTIMAANGHALAPTPDLAANRPDRLRLDTHDPHCHHHDDDDDDDVTMMEGSSVGGEGVRVNGEVGDVESEDAESVEGGGGGGGVGGGTAGGSPSKGRDGSGVQRASSVESGMHSFGLHSPDMVPAADVDFHSLGEGHPATPYLYSSIYSPDVNMIPRQRPDSVPWARLSSGGGQYHRLHLPVQSPPPSFANSNEPSPSPSDLSGQATSGVSADLSNGFPVSAVVSDRPGLMRSASSGHCPQVFDSDIEALIAQYYVPPPPSSSSDDDVNPPQVLSQSFSGVISGRSQPASVLDPASSDDISSLIIPPPPSSSSSSAHTDDQSWQNEAKGKRQFRHKRSSSVDIGALRLAQQQLAEVNMKRSLDSQDLGGRRAERDAVPPATTPPFDLQGLSSLYNGSHQGPEAESPASVSVKLHNLLKSLPVFRATELASEDEQSLCRTGSLRIPRSASLDLLSSASPSAARQKSDNGDGAPGGPPGTVSGRTLLTGSVSLGRVGGRKILMSQQRQGSTVSATDTGITPDKDNSSAPAANTGSALSGPENPHRPATPSDSLASLKAKLRDYRDHLLRRASLSSRKHSSDTDLAGKDKNSLKRSSSFSRLLSRLSGRRGSGSSDPGAVMDGESLAGEKGGQASSSSTGDLHALGWSLSPGGEEGRRPGTPVVRETLHVTRSSLRPVTTSDVVKLYMHVPYVYPLHKKSKKNGPLKALSSVFASEEEASENGFDDDDDDDYSGTPPSRTPPSPPQPSQLSKVKKNRQQYGSKDDLFVEDHQKKKQSKVPANPYATIKMWRPITMSSSVSHDDDAYRNFTNFDVLVADAKLPATGDLRNDNFHWTQTTSRPERVPGSAAAADSLADSASDRVHPQLSHGSGLQNVRNGKWDKLESFKSELDYRKQREHSGASSDVARKVKRAESLSLPSSAVTIPLTSRMLNVKEQRDQEMTLVPPPRRSRQVSRSSTISVAPSVNGVTADLPVDYPRDSSSSSGSRASRSLSRDGQDAQQRSPDRKGRSVMDSSHDVVSADVSESVRSVLSKTYGPEGFERAGQDVEVMLGHLRTTLETLKTSQAMNNSSGSQFQTVRQELQLQTKQFVLDARGMVAGATGSRQTVSPLLHCAMHTLSRMILHSQALMVRMRSVHQAQHVGFEVLKVTASFKSTVAAGTAALGRATTDPHMKYLMRQATHLAGLLTTLVKTLKNLEQA